jgi:hypothetical protein
MTIKTYDEKCYRLAEQFLEDEPELYTMDKCHHLACAIQQAVEDFIESERSTLEKAQ